MDGQYLILNFECLDGRKPRFICLTADVVFDNFEAIVPDGQVVLAHGKMGYWSGCKKGEGRNEIEHLNPVANRMQDSDKLAEKKMDLGLTFRFFHLAEASVEKYPLVRL